MKKSEALINLWKNRLVRHRMAYISLSHIEIPESAKTFLSEIGLPILAFDYVPQFLPATSFHSIIVEQEAFYILGDFNPIVAGVSFVAIKHNSERIYLLKIEKNLSNKKLFLNSSIEKFFIFLTEYAFFQKKYIDIPYPQINYEEIQKDYTTLKETLYQEDSDALSTDAYWCERIDRIEVEFADYIF